MKNDVQRLGDYLAHLLEAIERVQRYTEGMVESVFLNSPMVQDAVVRNFEVIGEASKNIEKHYPQFVARHPELPFAPAYQMRNSLAHGYFKVDFVASTDCLGYNISHSEGAFGLRRGSVLF